MIRNANKKDLNKIVDLWLQMSLMHESLDDSFKLKKGAQEKFKNYASNVIEDKEKLTIVYYSVGGLIPSKSPLSKGKLKGDLQLNANHLLNTKSDEEQVLGYLFAEIIVQPPVYYDEKIGLISEISVDDANRRKGIGEKLLQYSESWFKEKGVKRIDCQVASKNLVSTNFWDKNGFVEHSRICSKLI